MDPRFTRLACLIAILVLLAPVPGLADGIEVADKQGVPAQIPAPEVTAGEEGDDPEDNPDQGAGWTWPGKAKGGKSPAKSALPPTDDAVPGPAPAVTAGEEGDDPEDNPDQGAGFTLPRKATGGDRPVERALPRPADAAPESTPGPAPAVTAGEEGDDPEDNPDQGAGWTWPGKAKGGKSPAKSALPPTDDAMPGPAPAPAVTAGEEGDDPEDNPDQGAGWTWPGKAKGNHKRQGP